MPPIWDTLTRPGQPVAQSTSLFTQYPSGPPHTSPAYHDPRYHLRSWSRRSYTDPRLVASMMGEEDMAYSLVPGVVSQVQAQQAEGRGGAISGLGISPTGATIAGGLAGAAIAAAIEGLFVYGVTRCGAGVESAKAKKAALWAGGIVFGLSTIMTFVAAGGVAAATKTA
jgi:hypothetical protein